MSREQTTPQAATSTADGLTFQQKSNILTLIITSVVLLFYIARMVPLRPAMVQDPTMPAGFGGLVVTTVVVFIVIEAVMQAVLAFGASGSQEISAETTA